MKKAFRFEGLECAHCAAKLEAALKKLDGVTSAAVNFITQKMTIEADDERFDEIVKAAAEEGKKMEKDFRIKG